MKKAMVFAVLAALFYAVSTPLSKILVAEIPSTLLAGFLYLGAGLGMSVCYLFLKVKKKAFAEESLQKRDFPYVLLMVVLDIAAPIFLMSAVALSEPSSVSLINNFEIVATSLIALLLFKEKISARLWTGIALVTVASAILSVDFTGAFSLNIGSLLALLACLCWGFENNCTRKIADKNPFQIVVIKGIFSGLGAIAVGCILQEKIGNGRYVLWALALGFVAYGLSVFLYVKAQKHLGAAKTSAFYSLAPFLGVSLSMAIFQTPPHFTFFIALAVMALAMVFIVKDKLVEEKNEPLS